VTVSATRAPAARPSLWRNRDFLIVWSGQIVSTLGTRMSGTAFPLLVLAITGSPSDAGVVGAAGTLPYLIGHLPAGPLVDRWDRRTVMVVSEATAGLALAAIPVAMALGRLTLLQLALTAFVQGLCSVFFGLAEYAALPRLVPAEILPAALAQNEAKGRGASLAGPPLGGLLFGAGRMLPFLADAISSLVSAVALLFVRTDLRDRRSEPRESLGREALAGLRWVWGQRLVRTALLLIAASNIVFQALGLVIVVLARRHGASPAGIGLMLGIYGGGGLLGALCAGRLHPRFSPGTVVVGANWVWTALLPLFALTSQPVLLGVIGAAAAFIGPLWNVVVISSITVLVPDELLGRVGSAGMTLSWGVMPLASLGGGYLLAASGPERAVLVLTAVMAAAAIAATLSPALRQAPRPGAGGDGNGRADDGRADG